MDIKKTYFLQTERSEFKNLDLNQQKNQNMNNNKFQIKLRQYESQCTLEQCKTKLYSKYHLRKEMSFLLFILNIMISTLLSFSICYMVTHTKNYPPQLEYVPFIFCPLGAILSLISCKAISSWKQTLLNYVILDQFCPVIISSCLGFYAARHVFYTGVELKWTDYLNVFNYPLWGVYLSHQARIFISYMKWSKYRVFVFKLQVLASGIGFFYVGVWYMNGGYKITNGMYQDFQAQLKNVTLLYVFGNSELMFEIYRRLSQFDKSLELKYEYLVEDPNESDEKLILQTQINILEEQINLQSENFSSQYD